MAAGGRDAGRGTPEAAGSRTRNVLPFPSPALSAETVQRMVEGYRDAGDEIWAVVPEADQGHGNPMLLGRRMIELFLRGRQWSAAEEILAAVDAK